MCNIPDITQQPWHTAAYPWAAPDAPQFYDEKEYEPELDEVREETIFEEIQRACNGDYRVRYAFRDVDLTTIAYYALAYEENREDEI